MKPLLLFVSLGLCFACQPRKKSDAAVVNTPVSDGSNTMSASPVPIENPAAPSPAPSPMSSDPVKGVNKMEPSCSDAVDVPCVTKDPEILAFRKQQVRTLYMGLIYPAPLEIMKDPTKANHLFQEGNVKGRVTPVGQFTDFDGVVEYFYALAANVGNHVYDVEIVSLLGDEDQVSVNVNLAFCLNTVKDCKALSPLEKKKGTLTETGIFRFNKQNRIIFFDVIIPNLGAAYDEKNVAARAARIAGICTFLTVSHLDVFTQKPVNKGTCTSYFDNKDDFGDSPKFIVLPNSAFLNCMAFMGSIPFGTYDRANSNSFTCRQTHALLTPLRPEVHCKHVAFDGGGKCVDFAYETFYDEIKADPAHEH